MRILEKLDFGYDIFQDDTLYKFTKDPVLLVNFSSVKKKDVVVDFGSGTGIIPILIHGKFSPSKIFGIEIQEELFEMSKESLCHNNIENVEILHGKIQDVHLMLDKKVDVVFSNPPYYKTSDKASPKNLSASIARNEVKINIAEIVESAGRILKTRGRFFLCYTTDRLVELMYQLYKNRFGVKRIQFVSAVGKKSHLFMVECIYDSAPETILEENLYLR